MYLVNEFKAFPRANVPLPSLLDFGEYPRLDERMVRQGALRMQSSQSWWALHPVGCHGGNWGASWVGIVSVVRMLVVVAIAVVHRGGGGHCHPCQ
jgi:hypothetical protein